MNTPRIPRIASVLLLPLLAACTNVGKSEIAIPLEVAGTAMTDPIEGRDDWQITLTEASVAFGPLHLCGGDKAGDLCDTARAEWTGTVVVDALDDTPQPAGWLEGNSGITRSFMYDHGITSLVTHDEPRVLAAALELSGSSVVIVGDAVRQDDDGTLTTIRFSAEIPILQGDEDTEIGVPVVRKSGSDDFLHDITGDESFLRVRFDPSDWFADVDFEAVAALPVVVKNSDGSLDASLTEDTQGFRAVETAIVAGERPRFEWSTN